LGCGLFCARTWPLPIATQAGPQAFQLRKDERTAHIHRVLQVINTLKLFIDERQQLSKALAPDPGGFSGTNHTNTQI